MKRNLNSSESARNVVVFFLFCFLNEGLFDLPRSEKQNEELFIFEKGAFGLAQVETVELSVPKSWGLSRGTYPYCPYMGLLPPSPPRFPGSWIF